MVRSGVRKSGWLLCGLLCARSFIPAQPPRPGSTQLNESGQISVDGRSTPFVIRRLPLTSFPGLPAELEDLLNRRGCLIPQTYEAHQPENVIHASLERAGSSDWAVLCSVNGTVSLLVFFSSSPTQLQVVAGAPETTRLQAHDKTGILGFNWGIDQASPEHIHESQTAMEHRPPLVDHDALADSVIDRHTVYRFYSKSTWTVLDVPE